MLIADIIGFLTLLSIPSLFIFFIFYLSISPSRLTDKYPSGLRPEINLAKKRLARARWYATLLSVVFFIPLYLSFLIFFTTILYWPKNLIQVDFDRDGDPTLYPALLLSLSFLFTLVLTYLNWSIHFSRIARPVGIGLWLRRFDVERGDHPRISRFMDVFSRSLFRIFTLSDSIVVSSALSSAQPRKLAIDSLVFYTTMFSVTASLFLIFGALTGVYGGVHAKPLSYTNYFIFGSSIIIWSPFLLFSLLWIRSQANASDGRLGSGLDSLQRVSTYEKNTAAAGRAKFLAGMRVVRVSFEDWQSAIKLLLKKANIIIVDVSDISDGITWELNQIRESGALPRCVFIHEQPSIPSAALVQLAASDQDIVSISYSDWSDNQSYFKKFQEKIFHNIFARSL